MPDNIAFNVAFPAAVQKQRSNISTTVLQLPWSEHGRECLCELQTPAGSVWEKERKGRVFIQRHFHYAKYAKCSDASYSFSCKLHRACLSFVAFTRGRHQHEVQYQTSNCSLLLIYRPRKDERLSWPGWLICSGWLTHISGHPSAAGRAQDRESSPAKTDALTTESCHQPVRHVACLAGSCIFCSTLWL